VTRLIGGEYCQTRLDAYPKHDGMKGLGFDDEGAQVVGAKFDSKHRQAGRTKVESDISGWEKSYSTQLALGNAGVVLLTCKNPSQKLRNAYNVWAYSLGSVPMVLSDGRIFVKKVYGLMGSGDYFTTDGNTNGRLIAADLVGSDAMAMGDDCDEWMDNSITLEALIAAYKALGLNIRDAVVSDDPDSFTFCSHRFWREKGTWKNSLVTYPRMVYMYSLKKVRDELADYAIENEVRHDPEVLGRVREFLRLRNVCLDSPSFQAKQNAECVQDEEERCEADTFLDHH